MSGRDLLALATAALRRLGSEARRVWSACLRAARFLAALGGAGLAALVRTSFPAMGKAAVWVLAALRALFLKLPHLLGLLKAAARAPAAALPYLLRWLRAAVRAGAVPVAFVWTVGQALWATLRPYLRRFLRMLLRHKIASAITFAGLFAIALLLQRPAHDEFASDAAAQELVPYPLGALLPLTGKHSDHGLAMLQGYRIAIEAVNQAGLRVDGAGAELTLVIYDDESDPQRAAELAGKLAADPTVRVLLAPYSSAVALPAARATAGSGKPMLAPVASSAGFPDGLPPGMLLLQAPAQEHLKPAALLLLDQARRAGIELSDLRVALARLQDPHSAAVAAGVSEVLARAGVPPPQLIDLAAPEEEFDAAIDAADAADAIFAAGYGPGANRLVRALRARDARPLLLALTHCPSGRIGSAAPRVSLGALCMLHWQPQAAYPGQRPLAGSAFAAAYQQRYGEQAPHQAAAAAAAIAVIADALRRAELAPETTLIGALRSTDLRTFYGPVKFDRNGINSAKQMLMSQLQLGQLIPIWPARAATGSHQPVEPISTSR